jgi:succinoglycan biosynthesis protein ExoL
MRMTMSTQDAIVQESAPARPPASAPISDAASRAPRIAYFVHNLNDSAVAKRVKMLIAGGASVQLVGFWRGEAPSSTVAGAQVFSLGETSDLQLLHRAAMVIRWRVMAARLESILDDPDILIARNLETLAIAARFKSRPDRGRRLVYECLDIHRLMFNRGAPGHLMRGLERALLRRVDALVVSSSAFLTQYFEAQQHWKGECLLVENKVLELKQISRPLSARPSAPPWRIGWFGMIRCSRSLRMLSELARQADGRIQVVIRGRICEPLFEDFYGDVAKSPHITYQGPYSADDLTNIYSTIHFAWAIDYFEAGLNSSMLLPNRLYEASLHGTPPIALADVETGAWLAKRSCGLRVHNPETQLPEIFASLNESRYRELSDDITRIPVRDLVDGVSECEALVRHLQGNVDADRT